jgi:hypothetical protein
MVSIYLNGGSSPSCKNSFANYDASILGIIPQQSRHLRRKAQTFAHKNILPSMSFDLPSNHYRPPSQDYDGEPGDVSAGVEYFIRRFMQLARRGVSREREIYVQYVSPVHSFLSSPRRSSGAASSTTTVSDTAALRVLTSAVTGNLTFFSCSSS